MRIGRGSGCAQAGCVTAIAGPALRRGRRSRLRCRRADRGRHKHRRGRARIRLRRRRGTGAAARSRLGGDGGERSTGSRLARRAVLTLRLMRVARGRGPRSPLDRFRGSGPNPLRRRGRADRACLLARRTCAFGADRIARSRTRSETRSRRRRLSRGSSPGESLPGFGRSDPCRNAGRLITRGHALGLLRGARGQTCAARNRLNACFGGWWGLRRGGRGLLRTGSLRVAAGRKARLRAAGSSLTLLRGAEVRRCRGHLRRGSKRGRAWNPGGGRRTLQGSRPGGRSHW